MSAPILPALRTAAAWLTQRCTACTCPKTAVRDLDVDPDCPGLHRTADGCRTHSHTAALLALADADVRPARGTRGQLRALVVAMLDDLAQTVPDYVPSPAAAAEPAAQPAQQMRSAA